MRRVDNLLEQYGESHQNKTNVMIHAVAVPSIYFVIFGLVWSAPVPEFIAHFNVTWAHITAVPVLWYYFKLSGPIGAAMTLLTIGVFQGIELIKDSEIISVWLFSLIVFIVMWVLQFVGHHVEGKKPSFLKDLQFLLVGPAWWWGHWLKRLKIPY